MNEFLKIFSKNALLWKLSTIYWGIVCRQKNISHFETLVIANSIFLSNFVINI